MNRNLWTLVALQGLFLTNNVTFIAINGLVHCLPGPDAAGNHPLSRRFATPSRR